ncbi:hypothetical protein EON77_10395 [bacterium]|nr:MAG: hypothetical protein EON77_10395 [bacterium]
MLTQWLLLLQGGFYLLTGAWPLLHMRSFVAVTGPKTDLWLVRMVAALALAIGLALLVASREPRANAVVALGIGSALAFLTIDVVYVSKRTIGPIYLGDAAFEVVTLVGWGMALAQR